MCSSVQTKWENVFTKIKTLHFLLKDVCHHFRHDWNDNFQKLFNAIWTVTMHFSFFFKIYKRQRQTFKRFFWNLCTLIIPLCFCLRLRSQILKISSFSSKSFNLCDQWHPTKWSSCDSKHQQWRWFQEGFSIGFLHP